MLADVIFYCKMTSVMTLDAVRKKLQIQVNMCNTVQLLAGILQCRGGKFEEAEAFKCVFVAYCVLESK